MSTHRTRLALLSALSIVILQSGCTTLRDGPQYEPPKSGDPVATLRMAYEQDAFLAIKTFNNRGCASGITGLSKEVGDVSFRVKAEERLTLQFQKVKSMQVCTLFFAFTPERGAIYTVEPEYSRRPRTGDLAVLGDQDVCGVNVIKTLNTVETIEPLEYGHIDPGFSCSTWVPD